MEGRNVFVIVSNYSSWIRYWEKWNRWPFMAISMWTTSLSNTYSEHFDQSCASYCMADDRSGDTRIEVHHWMLDGLWFYGLIPGVTENTAILNNSHLWYGEFAAENMTESVAENARKLLMHAECYAARHWCWLFGSTIDHHSFTVSRFDLILIIDRLFFSYG